ncbi:hypothetical protein N7492_006981 [Penicillium capsulatum]|uniref:Uncharacterized protein n=1 Tax=Penicillium capsulatum TaxID=69766 RepID=A0A9W9I0E5_9EURO|nr:hypothetical protein N7492_006981 [Penicillium capsulatum]KAJ6116814.1 hypothetical protein N7512_006539 [Penicillium capsulatum]
MIPLAQSPSTRCSDPKLAKLGLMRPEIHHLTPDERTLFTTWCTRTSQSIAHDENSRHLWGKIIAREALQCPAVFNSILALSALQLACSSAHNPTSQRWLDTAQTYWNLAEMGFTKASSQSRSTSGLLLFVQSITRLILPFAQSQLRQTTNSISALEGICELFRQMRGPDHRSSHLVDACHYDPLSPLVAPDPSSPGMPFTAALAILGLKQLNSDVPHRPTRAIYNETIDHLNSCLAYTKCSTDPGLPGLSWILRVPSAYLDLVQSRDTLALIILAHYCVVMFHARGRWWMGDWGALVLQAIASTIGRDHLASIGWVIDATGIVIGGI